MSLDHVISVTFAHMLSLEHINQRRETCELPESLMYPLRLKDNEQYYALNASAEMLQKGVLFAK